MADIFIQWAKRKKKRKEGGDLWENAEIQTGTTQRIKAKLNTLKND